jgi:hypothetical protein
MALEHRESLGFHRTFVSTRPRRRLNATEIMVSVFFLTNKPWPYDLMGAHMRPFAHAQISPHFRALLGHYSSGFYIWENWDRH